MSVLTTLFIYLLIWWLVLFTVLPIGVTPHGEAGKGYAEGAPHNPRLKQKLILTSAIAAVIVAVLQGLVVTGVIDWHKWFGDAFK